MILTRKVHIFQIEIILSVVCTVLFLLTHGLCGRTLQPTCMANGICDQPPLGKGQRCKKTPSF